MPSNWIPIIYISGLCLFALALFLLLVAWARVLKSREEPLTPEEKRAQHRQGNVLGCVIFMVWGLMAIFWGIGQVFHVEKEQLQGVFLPIVFVLAIGGGIYLAVSAIRDRISVIGNRGGPPMKGQDAVTWGIGLLAIIAVVLYVVWLKINGQ